MKNITIKQSILLIILTLFVLPFSLAYTPVQTLDAQGVSSTSIETIFDAGEGEKNTTLYYVYENATMTPFEHHVGIVENETVRTQLTSLDIDTSYDVWVESVNTMTNESFNSTVVTTSTQQRFLSYTIGTLEKMLFILTILILGFVAFLMGYTKSAGFLYTIIGFASIDVLDPLFYVILIITGIFMILHQQDKTKE